MTMRPQTAMHYDAMLAVCFRNLTLPNFAMVSYHHIKFYYFVLSFPDALRIFLNRQPGLSKEEVKTRLAAVNKHVVTLLRDVTNSAKK